jgi:hypothetical protein
VKPTLLISGHNVHQTLWPSLSAIYDLAFIYPGAAQYAAGLGIKDPFGINEAFTSQAQERALASTARIVSETVQHLPNVAARMAANFNGQRSPALESVEDWWAGYILQQANMLTQIVTALDEVQAKRPIVGCLVHEDVTLMARAPVNWCKARGIPTIHIPHAMCHLQPSGGPDIHRETRTDWIGASGTAMRDFYAGNPLTSGAGGHPADKIEIVGAPQWDYLYDASAMPTRAEARSVLDVDGLVVTYAATWSQTTALRGGFDDELDAGLQGVIKAAHDLGATLIVNVHRSCASGIEEWYTKQVEAGGIKALVTRQHFNYVLRASDVVIAQGPSNVCLDALIAGTPACYIQSEGFDYAHPLLPRGSVREATELIAQALGVRDWGDLIKVYNDAHPIGDATQRCIEFIADKCKEKVTG